MVKLPCFVAGAQALVGETQPISPLYLAITTAVGLLLLRAPSSLRVCAATVWAGLCQ